MHHILTARKTVVHGQCTQATACCPPSAPVLAVPPHPSGAPCTRWRADQVPAHERQHTAMLHLLRYLETYVSHRISLTACQAPQQLCSAASTGCSPSGCYSTRHPGAPRRHPGCPTPGKSVGDGWAGWDSIEPWSTCASLRVRHCAAREHCI